MVTGGPSGGFKKGPQVLNKMYDHFIIVVFDFVKNIERKKNYLTTLINLGPPRPPGGQLWPPHSIFCKNMVSIVP